MSPNRLSQQQIAERESQVLRMKSEGMSYLQVGQALGISRQFAHEIHHRAMSRGSKIALDEAKEGA